MRGGGVSGFTALCILNFTVSKQSTVIIIRNQSLDECQLPSIYTGSYVGVQKIITIVQIRIPKSGDQNHFLFVYFCFAVTRPKTSYVFLDIWAFDLDLYKKGANTDPDHWL